MIETKKRKRFKVFITGQKTRIIFDEDIMKVYKREIAWIKKRWITYGLTARYERYTPKNIIHADGMWRYNVNGEIIVNILCDHFFQTHKTPKWKRISKLVDQRKYEREELKMVIVEL